jgi:hypothetical protein
MLGVGIDILNMIHNFVFPEYDLHIFSGFTIAISFLLRISSFVCSLYLQ